MTTKNIYVDVHILQDIPPANLNRDDSGSPKSATYGGVKRLRVSSQAWKRATRKHFSEAAPMIDRSLRTRRIHETLNKALIEAGMREEVVRPITAQFLEDLAIKESTKGKKEEQKDVESAYLFFFSVSQIEELSRQVVARPELWNDPKALSKEVNVKTILGKNHSLAVAAFGRMVADLPEINVDAAVQVSHALATHSSPTEFDYFTAVDDAQDGDETGAGMIGTIEFNSATLYRYASISVPLLIENMGDKNVALDGVSQFIKSFVLSMPTGKQNTFAAHTRPGLVMVTIREDQPVNYISAFERPVRAGLDGYLGSSVKAFTEFVSDEKNRWGDSPLAELASYSSDLADFARPLAEESLSLATLVERVRSDVGEALSND